MSYELRETVWPEKSAARGAIRDFLASGYEVAEIVSDDNDFKNKVLHAARGKELSSEVQVTSQEGRLWIRRKETPLPEASAEGA